MEMLHGEASRFSSNKEERLPLVNPNTLAGLVDDDTTLVDCPVQIFGINSTHWL